MSGIYKTENRNLTGYVKAYNKGSAVEMMKWVQANKTCFCESCVEQLAKDYSVYIESSSTPHTITQTLPGGVHAV